jgi:predicted PilT family ATPase
MVNQLDDKVVIVFTDKTSPLVKEKMTKRISEIIDANSVYIWDSATLDEDTTEKINIYSSIIHHSQRVVLTADLDYACAHAVSKR